MSAEFPNGTPARVHRPTGTVELAPSFFRLSPDQRRFVLEHEIGHWRLDTRDEYVADRYAADAMRNVFGLKRTFRSLNDTLHATPQSDSRRVALFNYLADIDNRENGNDMKTIGDAVYCPNTDTIRECRAVEFVGDGFTFTNNFIEPDFSVPAHPVEVAEFCQWCSYMGVPCNISTLSEYRKAKSDAWSNAENDAKPLVIDESKSRIKVVDPDSGKRKTGILAYVAVAAAVIAAIVLIVKS